MTTDPGCAEVRLSLPEFALGTLTGQERARVLEHLGTCAECRRELHSFVEIGDELLLLAPTAEPSVGFESRVLEHLPAASTRRRRAGGWALAAAALLAAAAVGGAGTYLLDKPDRELAAGYRETLGVANGRYVAARPLVENDGSEIGYVFGYEGSPSWIFCVVRSGEDGIYEVEIATADGASVAGEMQVTEREGTWHHLLETDLHALRSVRLIERSTGETMLARW